MPILEEVPGALERPSGCRIEIRVSDDGPEATITIPAQIGRPLLLVGAGILVVNLLLVLYVGAMLLFAHRSVLLMNEIAPGGLSPPLRHYQGWLIPAWGLILGIGVTLVLAILRPLVQREDIHIGPDGVSHVRRAFGRADRLTVARTDVRGFHLARDPQGMGASVLTLQGRGVERAVAEQSGEADREWLVSVGNALLRRW